MFQLVLQHVVRCCNVERGAERSDSSFGPTLGSCLGARPHAMHGECCLCSVLVQLWQGVSPVSVQMWQGGPSPGAEEAGAGPVSEQMWQG